MPMRERDSGRAWGQGRNETLFYRVVTERLAEMMPYICEAAPGSRALS